MEQYFVASPMLRVQPLASSIMLYVDLAAPVPMKSSLYAPAPGGNIRIRRGEGAKAGGDLNIGRPRLSKYRTKAKM